MGLISLTGSICHSLNLTVYRILHFSVDFEESPMFTESKTLSLLRNVGLAGVLLSVFRERCVGP